MSQGDYPDRKLPVMPLQELRISTRSRRARDQGTSQRHLRCGRYDRCLHVTTSNPGNGSEFDQNDEESYRHCRVESRDQERQRMADPTERCHDTETNPRAQGWPRPVRVPFVRECLGETHADCCDELCGQSDKKRIPGVSSCKSSREHWCQRR